MLTKGDILLIVVGIAWQAVLTAALYKPASADFATYFGIDIVLYGLLWGLIVTIMRAKHREPSRWLILAFLLGPLLAIVISLFFPKKSAAPTY